MKKIALALTAMAALTGSAVAADMAPRYAKAPAPMPVAVASWTGCYIAGGGGYGLWNQENTTYDPRTTPRTQLTATTTAGGRGYFGTVGGGCDYQFSLGNWQMVIGAFGDYDFASIKGTFAQIANPCCSPADGSTCCTKCCHASVAHFAGRITNPVSDIANLVTDVIGCTFGGINSVTSKVTSFIRKAAQHPAHGTKRTFCCINACVRSVTGSICGVACNIFYSIDGALGSLFCFACDFFTSFFDT